MVPLVQWGLGNAIEEYLDNGIQEEPPYL